MLFRNGNIKSSDGFSLVELLMVILISSMMIGAMVIAFVTNRDASVIIKRMKVAEENARIAVNFIGKDLAGGYAGSLVALDNMRVGGIYYSSVNDLDVVSGSDILGIFVSDLPEGDINLDGSNPKDCKSGYKATTSGTQGRISISKYYFSGMQSFNIQGISSLKDRQLYLSLCQDPTVSCIAYVDDAVLKGQSDCIVELTIDRTKAKDEASQSIDCTELYRRYSAGDKLCLSIGRFYYYYVGKGERGVSGSTNSQLIRLSGKKREVIADNVIDMQISYGVDTDDDGNLNNWVTAPSTASDSNLRGGSTTIKSVNVEILLNTAIGGKSADQNISVPKLSNSNIAKANAKGFLRRVSRTFKVRN